MRPAVVSAFGVVGVVDSEELTVSELELNAPAVARPTRRAAGASTRPIQAHNRVVPARDRWETRYVAATVAVDVVAITVSVAIGYLLGLGTYIPQLGNVSPGVGVVAGLLMIGSLLACRAWDPRILGQGSQEFSRLLRAVVTSAVLLSLLGLLLQALAARPWVFGLMPMAGLLAVGGRLALRANLNRLRAQGRCVLPVLVVGTPEA